MPLDAIAVVSLFCSCWLQCCVRELKGSGRTVCSDTEGRNGSCGRGWVLLRCKNEGDATVVGYLLVSG